MDKALESFEKSLEILPDYLYALEHKAEVLAFKGKLNHAKEIYEKVIQNSPEPELKTALARLYLEQEKKKEADSLLSLVKIQYDKYLALNLEAFNRHIAEFYLKWNLNLEKALELAQKELQNRQDIYSYDLLAWAYYKNRKYSQAWDNIALALSQKTQDAKLFYHGAVIAKVVGKKKESELYFSQARAINPQFEKMYVEN